MAVEADGPHTPAEPPPPLPCRPAVDVALPQQRIAVEVDGPTHYCRNRPHRPVGATLLKRRLLRQQGWAVVSGEELFGGGRG